MCLFGEQENTAGHGFEKNEQQMSSEILAFFVKLFNLRHSIKEVNSTCRMKCYGGKIPF